MPFRITLYPATPVPASVEGDQVSDGAAPVSAWAGWGVPGTDGGVVSTMTVVAGEAAERFPAPSSVTTVYAWPPSGAPVSVKPVVLVNPSDAPSRKTS